MQSQFFYSSRHCKWQRSSLFHGQLHLQVHNIMHKFPECHEMAPEDDNAFIETVVTCEGNLRDPDFSDRFQTFLGNLKSILYTSKDEELLKVKKIEPWNSVRVTISIPKEAAQKLKLLALQGSNVLKSLGILTVQVEGDQVISLTLAGEHNEPTEVLLRQSDGPSTSSPLLPLSLGPGQGPSAALSSLTSSPSSSAFRSPNVVAPAGESIPVLPPKSSGTTANPRGGPFPFASMTHAVQTMQRTDPALQQTPIITNNNSSSSSSNVINNVNVNNSNNNNPVNSTNFPNFNYPASPSPSSSPVTLHPQSSSISSTPQSVNSELSNSNSSSPVVNSSYVLTHNQHGHLKNDQGNRFVMQQQGQLQQTSGVTGSAGAQLISSQASPQSQSLQLQIVNVNAPPPYSGVNSSNGSSNCSNPSNSSVNNDVGSSNFNHYPQQQQQQQMQQQFHSSANSNTSKTNNMTMAITLPVSSSPSSSVTFVGASLPSVSSSTTTDMSVVRSVNSPLMMSTSQSQLIGDSLLTSGNLQQQQQQQMSSPLLVNLLQNNEALSPQAQSASSPSHHQQQQCQTGQEQGNFMMPPSSIDQQKRFLIQQQQPQQQRKVKRVLSLDGASLGGGSGEIRGGGELMRTSSADGSLGPGSPAAINAASVVGSDQGDLNSGSTFAQCTMPSSSSSTAVVESATRLNAPITVSVGQPRASSELATTAKIIQGRTIIHQGNVRVFNPGQIRAIRLTQANTSSATPSTSPTIHFVQGNPMMTLSTATSTQGEMVGRSSPVVLNGPHSNTVMSPAPHPAQSTSIQNPVNSSTIYTSSSSMGMSPNNGGGQQQQHFQQIQQQQQHAGVKLEPNNVVISTVVADQSSRSFINMNVNTPSTSPSTTKVSISSSINNPSTYSSSSSNCLSNYISSNTFIPPSSDLSSSLSLPNPHAQPQRLPAFPQNQQERRNAVQSPHQAKLNPSQHQFHHAGLKPKETTSQQLTSTGKPRQLLINPLTGHLEPMPSESSSDSDGEEGSGGTRRKLKHHSGKEKSTRFGHHHNNKGFGSSRSGGTIQHRQIVATTTTGVTVARVVKSSSLDSQRLSLTDELSVKKQQNTMVAQQQQQNQRVTVVPVTISTHPPPSVSTDHAPKKSREEAASTASTSAVSASITPKDKDSGQPGEKIKLRLKLEKNEPISPAYKVDVSFVKKSEKSSISSPLTTVSTSPGPSGSPGDQQPPRVPPLHISLRGKNAAVVVSSPRREEESLSPVNFFDGKSPSNAAILKSGKRTKSRVKSFGSSGTESDPEGGRHLMLKHAAGKLSRPRLSKDSNVGGIDGLKFNSFHEDPLKIRLEDDSVLPQFKSSVADPKQSTSTVTSNPVPVLVPGGSNHKKDLISKAVQFIESREAASNMSIPAVPRVKLKKNRRKSESEVANRTLIPSSHLSDGHKSFAPVLPNTIEEARSSPPPSSSLLFQHLSKKEENINTVSTTTTASDASVALTVSQTVTTTTTSVSLPSSTAGEQSRCETGTVTTTSTSVLTLTSTVKGASISSLSHGVLVTSVTTPIPTPLPSTAACVITTVPSTAATKCPAVSEPVIIKDTTDTSSPLPPATVIGQTRQKNIPKLSRENKPTELDLVESNSGTMGIPEGKVATTPTAKSPKPLPNLLALPSKSSSDVILARENQNPQTHILLNSVSKETLPVEVPTSVTINKVSSLRSPVQSAQIASRIQPQSIIDSKAIATSIHTKDLTSTTLAASIQSQQPLILGKKSLPPSQQISDVTISTSSPVLAPKKATSSPDLTPRKPESSPGLTPKKPESFPVLTPKKPESSPVLTPKKSESSPVLTPKKPERSPGTVPGLSSSGPVKFKGMSPRSKVQTPKISIGTSIDEDLPSLTQSPSLRELLEKEKSSNSSDLIKESPAIVSVINKAVSSVSTTSDSLAKRVGGKESMSSPSNVLAVKSTFSEHGKSSGDTKSVPRPTDHETPKLPSSKSEICHASAATVTSKKTDHHPIPISTASAFITGDALKKVELDTPLPSTVTPNAPLPLPLILPKGDEPSGSVPGEDSGIDSMDALSEKSPNQGESPARKDAEQYGESHHSNVPPQYDPISASVPTQYHQQRHNHGQEVGKITVVSKSSNVTSGVEFANDTPKPPNKEKLPLPREEKAAKISKDTIVQSAPLQQSKLAAPLKMKTELLVKAEEAKDVLVIPNKVSESRIEVPSSEKYKESVTVDLEAHMIKEIDISVSPDDVTGADENVSDFIPSNVPMSFINKPEVSPEKPPQTSTTVLTRTEIPTTGVTLMEIPSTVETTPETPYIVTSTPLIPSTVRSTPEKPTVTATPEIFSTVPNTTEIPSTAKSTREVPCSVETTPNIHSTVVDTPNRPSSKVATLETPSTFVITPEIPATGVSTMGIPATVVTTLETPAIIEAAPKIPTAEVTQPKIPGAVLTTTESASTMATTPEIPSVMATPTREFLVSVETTPEIPSVAIPFTLEIPETGEFTSKIPPDGQTTLQITTEVETSRQMPPTMKNAIEIPAHVEFTPKINIPVETSPEISAPVETTPEISAPVETTPEISAPVETTPEISAPVETTPEISAPVETTPEISAPVETTPEISAPVKTTLEISARVETTLEIAARLEISPEISCTVAKIPEIPVSVETTPELLSTVVTVPNIPTTVATKLEACTTVVATSGVPSTVEAPSTVPPTAEATFEVPATVQATSDILFNLETPVETIDTKVTTLDLSTAASNISEVPPSVREEPESSKEMHLPNSAINLPKAGHEDGILLFRSKEAVLVPNESLQKELEDKVAQIAKLSSSESGSSEFPKDTTDNTNVTKCSSPLLDETASVGSEDLKSNAEPTENLRITVEQDNFKKVASRPSIEDISVALMDKVESVLIECAPAVEACEQLETEPMNLVIEEQPSKDRKIDVHQREPTVSTRAKSFPTTDPPLKPLDSIQSESSKLNIQSEIIVEKSKPSIVSNHVDAIQELNFHSKSLQQDHVIKKPDNILGKRDNVKVRKLKLENIVAAIGTKNIGRQQLVKTEAVIESPVMKPTMTPNSQKVSYPEVVVPESTGLDLSAASNSPETKTVVEKNSEQNAERLVHEIIEGESTGKNVERAVRDMQTSNTFVKEESKQDNYHPANVQTDKAPHGNSIEENERGSKILSAPTKSIPRSKTKPLLESIDMKKLEVLESGILPKRPKLEEAVHQSPDILNTGSSVNALNQSDRDKKSKSQRCGVSRHGLSNFQTKAEPPILFQAADRSVSQDPSSTGFSDAIENEKHLVKKAETTKYEKLKAVSPLHEGPKLSADLKQSVAGAWTGYAASIKNDTVIVANEHEPARQINDVVTDVQLEAVNEAKGVNSSPISIVLPTRSVSPQKPVLEPQTPVLKLNKPRLRVKPGPSSPSGRRIPDGPPKLSKATETDPRPETANPPRLEMRKVEEPLKDEAKLQQQPQGTVTQNLPPRIQIHGVATTSSQQNMVNVSIATTPRNLPNMIQISKAVTSTGLTLTQTNIGNLPISVTASTQQVSAAAIQSSLGSITLPLQASGLSNAGTPGGTGQTLFAIHPNVTLAANLSHLQNLQSHGSSSITVLPGGQKIPVKLVTIPKQSQGQFQTVPLSGITQNRASPNILEAVNIVTNAGGSRSSSPKTLIGNSIHASGQLNLSSVSLAAGGNLHLVPISMASSVGGTSNPVKVLVSSPIKMQQAMHNQPMVVKSVIMGQQATTIRVVRPTEAYQVKCTPAVTAIKTPPSPQIIPSDTIKIVTPPPKVTRVPETDVASLPTTSEVEVAKTAAVPPTRLAIVEKSSSVHTTETLYKHVEELEVLDSGLPQENDELPYEADIIHDEKDLEDVLAGEIVETVVQENGIDSLDYGVEFKTAIHKESKSEFKTLDALVHSGLHEIGNDLGINKIDDDDLSNPMPDSPNPVVMRSSSPLFTYGNRSTRNSRPGTRSPSPSESDVHGEDQEIIATLTRSPSQPRLSPQNQPLPEINDDGNGSPRKPDLILGVDTGLEINKTLNQELSIEIPPVDLMESSTQQQQQQTEGRKSTRSTRSNTRLVSPDITAFRSDTPKPTKFSSKPDALVLKNSPKPSPTGSLKMLSPTVSGLAITPSSSNRSSPILLNQPTTTGVNHGGYITSGNIEKHGGTNATGSINPSINSLKKGVGNKRRRLESDSSSASKDDNAEEKVEIDLNSRPGKRRCSENAAELIKACIGVIEDTPRRNSMLIKRMEESKLKEAKLKKAMATLVEENEDVLESVEATWIRGRDRSSRASSEDRSSSRGSSAQRSSKSSSKDEDHAKEQKSATKNNNRSAKERLKISGRDSPNQNTAVITPKSKKEGAKLTGSTGSGTGRRSIRGAIPKTKSPLTPAKTRTNVRKDLSGVTPGSDKSTPAPASTATAGSAPETENLRRKTRSSAAGKRHVDSADTDSSSVKRRRISKDAKS